MTESMNAGASDRRPISIGFGSETRKKLEAIASIMQVSLAGIVRTAVDEYLQRKANDPDIIRQAEQAKQRANEAAAQQAAEALAGIDSLFAGQGSTTAESPATAGSDAEESDTASVTADSGAEAPNPGAKAPTGGTGRRGRAGTTGNT